MRQALFCGIALLGLASGVDLEVFEPRSYDGTGNNENNLLWGAAETGQVRRTSLHALAHALPKHTVSSAARSG